MGSIISNVAGWGLTTLLGGLVGWLGAFVKRGFGRDKAIEQGMRVLLRARLEAIYQECDGGKQPISIEKKHDADEGYIAYHALGGNGWGSQMHDAIMQAPTKEG